MDTTTLAPGTRTTERLDGLQCGRAVAALMVVFFHINGFYIPDPNYYGFTPFPALGWTFAGVEFFFVLSGFIIAYVHWRDLGRSERAGAFAWKRFVRVLPTYWIIVAPLILAYQLIPTLGPENARNPIAILLSLTLLPMEEFPILVVAWTLQHEMFFYAAFALAILNLRAGLAAMALWFVGCAIANLVVPELAFPFSFLFSALNLLFLMGIGVQRLVSRWTPPKGWLWFAVGLALFCAVGFNYSLAEMRLAEPVMQLGFGAGAALMILGLVGAERQGRLEAPRWLRFLGDASYSLYLIHIPVIGLTAKLLFLAGVLRHIPPLVSFAGFLALAIAAAAVFHVAVERPVLRALQRRRAASA